MKPGKVRFDRSAAIIRLRRRLEAESYPRIQMAFIVALTGAAGLLCSYLLLLAGVHTMAVRYPLALAGAYLFFLFLLWVWLRTRDELHVDLPDAGLGDLAWPVRDASPPSFGGEGGAFGGGGASGRFDAGGGSSGHSTGSSSFQANTGTSPDTNADWLPAAGDIGSALDADELAIPLIAIGLAIGLALASLYIVWMAPVLFAELLFDGALSYTLYRNLRRADQAHWLSTAFRRTVVPFCLTAVFLAAIGHALHLYAPAARTLGEALASTRR